MEINVDVAEMKISSKPGDVIVTHTLGSSLGIAVHDPQACIGGLFHVMLPNESASEKNVKDNPYMYVDSGIPAFFDELYAAGVEKTQLVVKVAGGAEIGCTDDDFFQIGKRNFMELMKFFLKNEMIIASSDVGGNISRTMYLDVSTGRTWLESGGREWEI